MADLGGSGGKGRPKSRSCAPLRISVPAASASIASVLDCECATCAKLLHGLETSARRLPFGNAAVGVAYIAALIWMTPARLGVGGSCRENPHPNLPPAGKEAGPAQLAVAGKCSGGKPRALRSHMRR